MHVSAAHIVHAWTLGRVSEIVRVYNTTRLSQGKIMGTHTINYTSALLARQLPAHPAG